MRQFECKVGEELSPEELLDALIEHHKESLLKFLILNRPEIYQDAKYKEESFQLLSLFQTTNNSFLTFNYQYDWQITHACRDVRISDTRKDSIRLSYGHGMAKLQIEDGDERSTADEL